MIALDCPIAPINPTRHSRPFHAYLDHVSSLVNQITNANDSSIISNFRKVQEFILNETQYDVGDDGCRKMQEGFLDVVLAIQQGQLSMQHFETWKHDIISGRPDVIGHEKLDLNYLHGILDVFRSVKVTVTERSSDSIP